MKYSGLTRNFLTALKTLKKAMTYTACLDSKHNQMNKLHAA